MTGSHAGLMHGVPLTYNWALGPRVGVGNRPGAFTAVSAWGQIYESPDGSPARNLRVACRDMSLHLLSRCTHQGSGVNDSEAEAHALVRLLAGLPAKVNLIPFNPWPGSPYRTSTREAVERFADILNAAGYASPVRRPRGRDILAACGQLKTEVEGRGRAAA